MERKAVTSTISRVVKAISRVVKAVGRVEESSGMVRGEPTAAMMQNVQRCAARTLRGANTAQHERFAARTLCGTKRFAAGLHITRGDSVAAQETFSTICVKATPNGLMVSVQGVDARSPGSIPGTGTFTPFCSQPLSIRSLVRSRQTLLYSFLLLLSLLQSPFLLFLRSCLPSV